MTAHAGGGMYGWQAKIQAQSPWLAQMSGSGVAGVLLLVVGLASVLVLGVKATVSPSVDVEGRIRAHTEDWFGTPYEWGGATKAGVDCSAFTQLIFREQFGLEIPRRTNEQEEAGLEVARDSLKAGDLVFFRTGGFLGLFKKRHVGVYLSNGDFAHASTSKGVMVSSLDEPFWKKEYKTARRLLDKRGRPLSAAIEEG